MKVLSAIGHWIARVYEEFSRIATDPLQEIVDVNGNKVWKYSFTRITAAVAFAVGILLIIFVAVTHTETPHYIWTITALFAYSGGTKVVQKFAEK